MLITILRYTTITTIFTLIKTAFRTEYFFFLLVINNNCRHYIQDINSIIIKVWLIIVGPQLCGSRFRFFDTPVTGLYLAVSDVFIARFEASSRRYVVRCFPRNSFTRNRYVVYVLSYLHSADVIQNKNHLAFVEIVLLFL